ncbi:MAG: hypothetical protein ACR2NP_11690 [Pirellulaceae bacterium]
MKIASVFLSVVFVCGISGQALGQKDNDDDGPVGIFQSGAEYDQFMRSAKQAAYGEGGNPELQAMIPMLNDIAMAKPFGWTNQEYGGQGSSLDMLSDEKVRADLEMMDEQYEDLQQMNEEVQQRVAEQIRGLDFDDRENLATQIRAIRDRATEDLNSVLLPHQMDRLGQMQARSQLRFRSLAEVLTSDPLKSQLEITDEQAEDLLEAEAEIEQELAEEIARLRAEAREQLVGNLKRDQRDQVTEIFGDLTEASSTTRSQRREKRRRR